MFYLSYLKINSELEIKNLLFLVLFLFNKKVSFNDQNLKLASKVKGRNTTAVALNYKKKTEN